LINASSLQPIAGPSKTTAYILTVSDTLGCPKPVSDTVLVELFPIIRANAGNDTSVVVDQPLQLNATGGSIYKWSPSTGLSDPNIANPIAILGSDIDSIKYKVVVSSIAGCSGTDEIIVRVFKSGPEIYVPTAFTPNSDQRNDILKPITVGISKLNYFSVFNRWGQCVYTTNEFNKGWDGNLNGNKEATGTYVFIAEGVDYLGKKIYRKGTTVLIR
jgi:gliding motility-associated-like protein